MIEEGGVVDFVAYHAARTPAKTACAEFASGRRFTYRDLDRRVDACARFLTKALGPASGERVAMLSRNSADVLTLYLACIRAGAIFQPLNWRLTAPELAILVEDAAPRLFVHHADFDAVAEALSAKLNGAAIIRIAPVGDGFQAALDQAGAVAPTPLNADSPSLLLYTSGTTGRPKGVIVTARNAFFSCLNFGQAVDLGNESVMICDMPMFHVVGLFAASVALLFHGGSVLISEQFDASVTLDRLGDAELGVSHYFAVPQMVQRLYDHPARPGVDFSRLKAFCTGGAPIAPAILEPWLTLGVPVIDGFGMSEIGTGMCMPPGDPARLLAKIGSCGLPAMTTLMRLVTADGREAGVREVGELWVTGPNVSPGYWNRPDATAGAFQDGWLKTGDAAWRDEDGFYFLVDRLKDMYISGGENVYPAEVEAALLEIAGVYEAAVIGTPDPQWGESGVAFIVGTVDTPAPTEATVLDHCRARLARYKAPGRLIFIDTLPRTASGKVQKHVLREQAMQSLKRT